MSDEEMAALASIRQHLEEIAPCLRFDSERAAKVYQSALIQLRFLERERVLQ